MSFWKLTLVMVISLVCCPTLHAGLFPYKYKTVQVTVVDDETGEPVPNAKVKVAYSDTHYFYQPKPDSAVTDDQGVASVQVAQGTHDWFLASEAKDCFFSVWFIIPEREILKEETIRIGRRPNVTVIVPNGYAGPLKIEMPLMHEFHQKEISRRKYQFRANSEGYIDIDSINYQENYFELLRAVTESHISAIYEDGRPIPSGETDGVGESLNALRYVTGTDSDKSTRGRQLYVIGTKKDYDTLLKNVSKQVEVELELPKAWYEKKTILHKNMPKEKAFNTLFSDSRSTIETK